MEDVVGGGGAGEGVEGAEGGVEVEQEHFVGNAVLDGDACGGEGAERLGDGLMLAEVGEQGGFAGGGAGAGDCGDDGGAEFGEAEVGEGGSFDQVRGSRFGVRVVRCTLFVLRCGLFVRSGGICL